MAALVRLWSTARLQRPFVFAEIRLLRQALTTANLQLALCPTVLWPRSYEVLPLAGTDSAQLRAFAGLPWS